MQIPGGCAGGGGGMVMDEIDTCIKFLKHQSSILCKGMFKCQLWDSWVKRINGRFSFPAFQTCGLSNGL